MSALPWSTTNGDREHRNGPRRPSSRDSQSRSSRQRSGSHVRDFSDSLFTSQSRQAAHETAEGDDDILSPLMASAYTNAPAATNAGMRRNRPRVDSLSSIGSSVAPTALPQHRASKRWTNGGQFADAYSRESSAAPDAHYATYDGQPTGFGRTRSSSQLGGQAPRSSAGEGGLEAWLRSQAVAVPASSLDPKASTKDGFLSAMGERRRLDVTDALSEGGRSQGARSVDHRQSRTGSRRSAANDGSKRAGIPDWNEDANGSSKDSLTRKKDGSKSRIGDWLGTPDVDSQFANDRRSSQRRRELSAATMSASGVRLRESVRRMNRSDAEEQRASFGALLQSSAAVPRSSGVISASPSMGTGMGAQFLSSSVDRPGQQQIATGLLSYDSIGGAATSASRAAKGEGKNSSPLRLWAKHMLKEQDSLSSATPSSSSLLVLFFTDSTAMAIALSSAILIGVIVKWTVASSGSWSGRGKSPMFGDFEAQRHWIEITLHLPPEKWYHYDLQYWGLDYPPLTALVSQWCGLVAQRYFPGVARHFALDSSRGSEANEVDIFMHASVLLLDSLVYVPAILFFLGRKLQGRGRRTRLVAMLSVILQPSLVLVDYGHFQYNNVMLGFAAAAFALLYTSLPNPDATKSDSKEAKMDMRDRIKTLSRRISFEYIAAAVFFSLSLCFKQMALYYAPAVFAIMLGRCFGLARIGFERGLICFFGLALATVLTFGFCFRRWLGDFAQIAQIIHRIFPVARGLFEDKVSNIWCFLSVLPLPARYKIKNLLSSTVLARVSILVTLATILLPCIHLFTSAAETVHIEMFLDEESKRQLQASERRKAEGSVIGGSSISGRKSRYLSLHAVPPALSEVGSEIASVAAPRSTLGSAMLTPSQQRTAPSSRPDHRLASTVAASKISASSSPSPAAAMLPYAMLSVSLAFYLFGFQTHEKSILLPLLPMTLLMSVKGDEWGGGAGRIDWEWAVLMNNVATFSMWPLLQRDGLSLQYFVVTFAWSWAIGYRPFAGLLSTRNSFVGWLSAFVHAGMLSLHILEVALPALPALADPILARYPDLFAVLNVLFCTPLLVLVWLWSSKRQMEVGFAHGIDMIGFNGRSSLSSSSKQKKAKDVNTASVDRKTK